MVVIKQMIGLGLINFVGGWVDRLVRWFVVDSHHKKAHVHTPALNDYGLIIGNTSL